MNLPDKVKTTLREMPDEPGCYIMRDRGGRIIYVGKALSLRKRVQSYFRDAALRSADPKLRGLIKSVHALEYIVLRNEAEALLTEARLIKDYRPRYNVDFRDDKRFLLLRAEPAQPFPAFKLCRIDKRDGALYFGPYASSASARAALDFAEKKFGLRKCAPRMPDKNTYKHCINDIIRYCSAPCIGRVGEKEYHGRFTEACAFLAGDRPEYLKELREKMEEASSGADFERAAALRDTLFLLQAAVKQKARIASTPEMKRQEAEKGIEELKTALELDRVPRIIEAFDVSSISGTHAVAGMVCSVDGLPHKNLYRRFRIKTVEGIDDPGMIAEVIRRRYSRVVNERGQLPDMVLVDGGMTQVNAARKEMERLGLGRIAVAGLAKRMEEIFFKKSDLPLRLASDSAALKVVQRLRDEAHRFALAYHLRLRTKRIKESVLDEIPGVGPAKKRLLLERFGSVRRLMKATEDQIAAVPGIGYTLARQIEEEVGGLPRFQRGRRSVRRNENPGH